MGRARDRLTRGAVTEPPPVSPWLGLGGIGVGLATSATIAGVDVVRFSFGRGTWWWVLPIYLLVVAQLFLALWLMRRLTVHELRTWERQDARSWWRPYLAGGTGVLAAGFLEPPSLALAAGAAVVLLLAGRSDRVAGLLVYGGWLVTNEVVGFAAYPYFGW